jgi:hypothetical protein
LPYQRTFRTSDSPRVGLHVEGVFGYGRLTESTDDLYSGIDPDLRTAVDSKVTTYGFLAGVGPEFVVVDTFTITPIANFGLSRLESDADYTGPGAEFTAALADGIAFNWDAWAWSAGGAVRLDWSRPLSKTVNVELVGRYDFRWTGVFAADDDVQEFTSTIQMLTLRAQFTGPTGLAALGGDLYWRGILGYRRVLDGDLFDVTDFFQIGGALELDVKGRLPVGSRISLGGAIFLGESITGWSVGVGFSF